MAETERVAAAMGAAQAAEERRGETHAAPGMDAPGVELDRMTTRERASLGMSQAAPVPDAGVGVLRPGAPGCEPWDGPGRAGD